MDDEADHRESDTTHEGEILMKQHITPGTYFQVVDDEEIERDDEEPTTNEPWNNSAVRGGRDRNDHGELDAELVRSSRFYRIHHLTGSFQNAQQGPASQ